MAEIPKLNTQSTSEQDHQLGELLFRASVYLKLKEPQRLLRDFENQRAQVA